MYYKIPQIPISDKAAFTIGEFCARERRYGTSAGSR